MDRPGGTLNEPGASRPGLRGLDDLDVSVEVLGLTALPDDLKEALAYWESLKPAGTIAPSWSQIDMLRLPPRHLPTATVADHLPADNTYRYRYWGRELTPVFGSDLTGKTFDHVPKAFRDVTYRTYDIVRARRAPCLIRFRVAREDIETEFQTALRMPTSEDGATVSGVISLLLMAYRKYDLDRLWD